jgi:hypothetical protein
MKILQKYDKQHQLNIRGERYLVCITFFKLKYFIN